MMKRLFLYLLLLQITLSLSAQDVVLKATYPPVVTAGEQFAISWNVNAGGGEFSEPSFTGFYKLMGPQQSYSSSTQIINGKFSQQTSYTYTYFLQAMNEGKFVIPPASIRIKNKEYKSDSLYIEVIKETSAGQPVRNNNQNAQSEEAVQTPGSDLFIHLILNRSEVYQGEPIIATLKLYTRIDISGFNEVKFPDFKGFLNEQLETPRISLQRENVGGVIYGTGVIQQFLLYPQTTGELTIDPVEITALIQQKTGNSDPIFDGFFNQYRDVPKALASKPVKVKVKPLPETRPSGFSGIVGKIDLKASINKDTINVNDALNFKVTISGSGNLKVAGNPVFKLSPDIEVYEPKVTDNLKNSTTGTSGQKTFEYVLIPRHYGDFKVPSISYSYFNPSTGKYETLSTGEYSFYARKGSEQGSGSLTIYGGVSKEDVKYLGKDIRFIKSDPGKPGKNGNVLITRRSFLSLYGLSFILFIAVLIIRREHIRRNADISSVRNRKAAKIAGKRLAEASKCLKSDMLDRFHEEILKALWGYLSDKLNIPLSGLTRITVTEALKEKGIDESSIGKLSDILDKCEFARFAPASSNSEASEIYSGASDFIKSVENNI